MSLRHYVMDTGSEPLLSSDLMGGRLAAWLSGSPGYASSASGHARPAALLNPSRSSGALALGVVMTNVVVRLVRLVTFSLSPFYLFMARLMRLSLPDCCHCGAENCGLFVVC
jgi:hypothetical protein